MADKYSGWACNVNARIITYDNTTATIRVECVWKNQGWRYDMNGVSAWVYCNGSEVQVKWSSAVNTTGDNQGSYSLGYYDFVVSRESYWRSIACSAKITSTSSYVSGTKTSGDVGVGVDARPSYTVTYNANGGSGAPGSQTKWYDWNLTLSTAKPSRTGYVFSRWNTSTANNGTAYNPGGTYTGNADLTLYAIWSANGYTVSYDANGGSGAPANQTKTHDQNLTLSSTIPTRSNYNFLGWSTSPSGGVVYDAGGTYTGNTNITLYAVWSLGYTLPRITGYAANRCTSSGTFSETGKYIKVGFFWATDKDVTSIKIEWKESDDSAWSYNTTVSASGKDGSAGVYKIIGSNAISTEKTYLVRVSVSDSGGTTTTNNVLIGTIKYPIDIKSEGKGVAVGKVAELDDVFDIGYKAKFTGNIQGDINVYNSDSTFKISNKGNRILTSSGSYTVLHGDGGSSSSGVEIRPTSNSSYSNTTTFYTDGTIYNSYSGDIRGCTTLYENSSGSTGTISLSKSVANFDYIEIFYGKWGTSYSNFSTRVYNPNGKEVSLISSDVDNGNVSNQNYAIVFNTKLVNISGSTISSSKGEMRIYKYVQSDLVAQICNQIYIYKVVGYR